MNEDYMMMMSAINSFNNSLSNAVNPIIAATQSKIDKKFSKEMSDLAWQRNLEAWNMQNEYNLPANQYARQLEGLRVNGLNPNLVYGSSSSIGGAAGSVNPYHFSGYHSTAVPHMSGSTGLESFLNTRLLQTQVAAAEANNRLINARADNEESRNPGILAKSKEAAHRWQYITDNLIDNYDEALQGEIAKTYWTGVQANYDADIKHYKRDLAFYEAAIAEWLNTEEAPGTGMTYRQYMEACKAFLPGMQYNKFKADILDIASKIAYRKSQGELLDLKKEYQGYVNRLAKYGRSLGNDWINLLISGLEQIWNSGEKSENGPVYVDPWMLHDIEEAEK